MIIQSSSVGSHASRHYQSSQISYAEHSEWDNATGAYTNTRSSYAVNTTECSATYNGAVCAPFENSTEISEFTTPEENLEENNNNNNKSTLEREMDAFMNRFGSFHTKAIPTMQERMQAIQDIQRETLNHLLEILLGDGEKCGKSIKRIKTPAEKSANNPVTIQATTLGQNVGTGYSHYTCYYHSETETTTFKTTGTAVTADGRSLNFNISVEMSRSFTQMAEERIDYGQPRLCDPLVINLNTNIASVADQKFFFDIDADGEKEEISQLHKNSGYLALDKNEDGIVNDGSELFGTTSGNGFKDLLSYDEDGNGWIDEADSIFSKLKIWIMDENGESRLLDLKNSGVGAIYLGHEDTEFSLKNSANETNAVIQKTGLFLYENGMSGTVQQMDLAV